MYCVNLFTDMTTVGPKNSPPQGTSNSPTRVAPLALNTPPAFGKKSKAGIPPPPSHGTRNKASFSGYNIFVQVNYVHSC